MSDLTKILFLVAWLVGCGADNSAPDDLPDDVEGISDNDDPITGDAITEDEVVDDPIVTTTHCAPASTTCFPIVLAHGFAADTTIAEFVNVAVDLEEKGYAVYESEVSPYNSIEVRAGQLAANVDEALKHFGVDKVNIIAHSMGGLDSRYLVSELGYGDRVASITTISTPHQGALLADLFTDGSLADSSLIEAFVEFIGGGREVAQDPDLAWALRDISVAAAPAFNEANLDDERVYYQSWAGVSNVVGISRRDDDEACEATYWRDQQVTDVMDALLTPFALIASEGGLPHGNFRGCIRADHLDEIGQIFDFSPNDRTGFFHLDFYEDVAADLAERGF